MAMSVNVERSIKILLCVNNEIDRVCIPEMVDFEHEH